MRVRVVRPVGTVEGNAVQPGDVVDLSEGAAGLLIANGEAVRADEATVETATVGPVETATARKAPRTRKAKG